MSSWTILTWTSRSRSLMDPTNLEFWFEALALLAIIESPSKHVRVRAWLMKARFSCLWEKGYEKNGKRKKQIQNGPSFLCWKVVSFVSCKSRWMTNLLVYLLYRVIGSKCTFKYILLYSISVTEKEREINFEERGITFSILHFARVSTLHFSYFFIFFSLLWWWTYEILLLNRTL